MSAIYDYGKRREEEGKKIGKEEGKRIGKEEGKRIGKEEGNKKMAKYMIKEGKSNEEIQKETQLTIDEIEKLRN